MSPGALEDHTKGRRVTAGNVDGRECSSQAAHFLPVLPRPSSSSDEQKLGNLSGHQTDIHLSRCKEGPACLESSAQETRAVTVVVYQTTKATTKSHETIHLPLQIDICVINDKVAPVYI